MLGCHSEVDFTKRPALHRPAKKGSGRTTIDSSASFRAAPKSDEAGHFLGPACQITFKIREAPQ
jgi:hypothetical protein